MSTPANAWILQKNKWCSGVRVDRVSKFCSPFPSFRALSPNVYHAVVQLVCGLAGAGAIGKTHWPSLELDFRQPRRFYPRSEDVLICREISGRPDAFHCVEVAVSGQPGPSMEIQYSDD